MKKDIIRKINLSERGREMAKARNKKLSPERRKEISDIANKQKALMLKAKKNEWEAKIKQKVNED